MSPAVSFSLALVARLASLELPWTIAIVVGDANIHAAKLLLRAGEIDGLIGCSDSVAGPLIDRESRVEDLSALLDAVVNEAAHAVGRAPLDLSAQGAA
jgi:hypothetical protein